VAQKTAVQSPIWTDGGTDVGE